MLRLRNKNVGVHPFIRFEPLRPLSSGTLKITFENERTKRTRVSDRTVDHSTTNNNLRSQKPNRAMTFIISYFFSLHENHRFDGCSPKTRTVFQQLITAPLQKEHFFYFVTLDGVVCTPSCPPDILTVRNVCWTP